MRLVFLITFLNARSASCWASCHRACGLPKFDLATNGSWKANWSRRAWNKSTHCSCYRFVTLFLLFYHLQLTQSRRVAAHIETADTCGLTQALSLPSCPCRPLHWFPCCFNHFRLFISSTQLKSKRLGAPGRSIDFSFFLFRFRSHEVRPGKSTHTHTHKFKCWATLILIMFRFTIWPVVIIIFHNKKRLNRINFCFSWLHFLESINSN